MANNWKSDNISFSKLVPRHRHSKELTPRAKKFGGCIYIRFYFQTFIYSARALSRTKYMSVSNAFCLTCLQNSLFPPQLKLRLAEGKALQLWWFLARKIRHSIHASYYYDCNNTLVRNPAKCITMTALLRRAGV